MVEDQVVGLVEPDFARILLNFPSLFEVTETRVCFVSTIQTFEQRNQAIQAMILGLFEQKIIHDVMNEPYPVKGKNDEVFFIIDRSLVAYFGFRSFGQHLNGFVKKEQGLWLWIARRAEDRLIYPGKLDNMVAGGLPYGLSLEENLAKECYEEAGVSAKIASQAHCVSQVTYNGQSKKGYKPDTLLCYDLELPLDFQPINTDGEVADFELMPVETVINLVAHDNRFKPNCHLVLIDFFLRHDLIEDVSVNNESLRHALRVDFLYDAYKQRILGGMND